MNREEELIACLEAEIVKRDARIVELEADALQWRANSAENKLIAESLSAELAAPKAQPSGAVLPERRIVDAQDSYAERSFDMGYNSALDEVARLNPFTPGSVAVIPEPFDVRPFQTIDRGSVNYMTGFNAAIRKMRESVGRAQSVPKGCQVVPVQMTDEMRDAGNAYTHNRSTLICIWRDMLAAAPSAKKESGR